MFEVTNALPSGNKHFIHFYDDEGEFIKMERIYGDYDDMQNISPIDAKQLFEK